MSPQQPPNDDDIDLPVLPKAVRGPDCPFCGEPTVGVDGDFICFDCNGSTYGPDTG
jgi:hypothetical protein